MKKADIVVAISLAALAAASVYLQHRDEQLTPDEALVAVLAEVDDQVSLDALPLQHAIKQVRGKGELTLISFEDPYCPYCGELDRKLAHLDNVTLYTFLLPILSEDSTVKSRQIWCAPDPAAAWNDWMLKHRAPKGAGDCDTSALAASLELGEKMGIRGVPYLLQAK